MPDTNVTEILKKVQRIQIVANRTVNDLLAGQYKSIFRGRGMEFDEVREYQPGDDIRTIDWNVTARTGTAFIKRYCEERELTVMLLADVSASGAFGSAQQSKLDLLVEMAALLMFSALKNNDKVGLITFCERVIDYFPPRKGKANVLRLIRQLVSLDPVPRATNFQAPLDFLNQVQRRRAVVFLLSDFLVPADGQPVSTVDVGTHLLGKMVPKRASQRGDVVPMGFLGHGARHALAVTNRRHDLIAITVADPREQAMPDVGFVSLRDAETGEVVEVDTRHPRVRALFENRSAGRFAELSDGLKKLGVDQLAIRTDEDYMTSLRRFFHMRERRFR
jgi:uncharacterized protein (DUF58 family)